MRLNSDHLDAFLNFVFDRDEAQGRGRPSEDDRVRTAEELLVFLECEEDFEYIPATGQFFEMEDGE